MENSFSKRENIFSLKENTFSKKGNYFLGGIIISFNMRKGFIFVAEVKKGLYCFFALGQLSCRKEILVTGCEIWAWLYAYIICTFATELVV